MRHIALITCLPVIALLGGCARSRITTEIKPNGSWVRSTSFTGKQKKEGMQMGSTIEETFVVPSGAAWKSSEEKKDDDHTLTFVRTLAPDAALKGDLSIKGSEEGKLKLLNDVTVKRAGAGRFEYRETLHWTGPTPDVTSIKPEDIAKIKASLPAALATDENAKVLAQRGSALMLPLIFGPGDPLLAIALIHPDLAERRARQRVGALLLTALQDQFGDKLSPAERRQVAQKLISNTFSVKPSPPDSEKPAADKTGLTPLMFIVHMPGRVVSSNGEIDELTGEVYWALFPEAASLKDIVLTAICELDRKP